MEAWTLPGTQLWLWLPECFIRLFIDGHFLKIQSDSFSSAPKHAASFWCMFLAVMTLTLVWVAESEKQRLQQQQHVIVFQTLRLKTMGTCQMIEMPKSLSLNFTVQNLSLLSKCLDHHDSMNAAGCCLTKTLTTMNCCYLCIDHSIDQVNFCIPVIK